MSAPNRSLLSDKREKQVIAALLRKLKELNTEIDVFMRISDIMPPLRNSLEKVTALLDLLRITLNYYSEKDVKRYQLFLLKFDVFWETGNNSLELLNISIKKSNELCFDEHDDIKEAHSLLHELFSRINMAKEFDEMNNLKEEANG